MSHKPVDPSVVCEQLLFHASKGTSEGGELLTPMTLLKLVYISHGWMLGVTGWPLISETPEVWQYGPVVPSVYHRYKQFGGNYITEEGEDHKQDLDEFQRALILWVWKGYRGYSGIDLSTLTHKKGTPWVEAKKANQIWIDDKSIRKYYRKLAQDLGMLH